jgi:hypothetical protein
MQPSLAPSAGPILRRHQDYCGAMRLFRQPALDAPAVLSSTSKLCHFGLSRAPGVEFLAPTKPLVFRNWVEPDLHFTEAKLPHRSR